MATRPLIPLPDDMEAQFRFLFSIRLLFEHQADLLMPKEPRSFAASLSQQVDLTAIVRETTEDLKGFAVEKYGLAPRIKVPTAFCPDTRTELT